MIITQHRALYPVPTIEEETKMRVGYPQKFDQAGPTEVPQGCLVLWPLNAEAGRKQQRVILYHHLDRTARPFRYTSPGLNGGFYPKTNVSARALADSALSS